MIRCCLCTAELSPANASGVCAECRLIVRNRLGVAIEERWRDHPDGEHVVSDGGRIARVLSVDRAHRYPRVSIAGRKVYVHHLVAEAWHGPRPDGSLALHADDNPENPAAENLRWGSHADNAQDRIANQRKDAQ